MDEEISLKGVLRQKLRNRLLDEMIRKVPCPPGTWKVLVVDRDALRILAAALGSLSQLVNEGVTVVGKYFVLFPCYLHKSCREMALKAEEGSKRKIRFAHG